MTPVSAYDRTQTSALNGRAAEGEAFARAARDLHRAAGNLFDEATFTKAVKRNQKLWTILQASLRDSLHLPQDLRRDLLNLSLFVDQQTEQALAQPSYRNVESLIGINRNMAAGLFHGQDS